jgi:hypothetical protein
VQGKDSIHLAVSPFLKKADEQASKDIRSDWGFGSWKEMNELKGYIN